MRRFTPLLATLLISASPVAPIVRVAVIDTGLNLNDPRFTKVLCADGHADYTGEGIDDIEGHGTAVAGLIMQYAGKRRYCLTILKFYTPLASGKENMDREVMAIRRAKELGAKVVNISGGGDKWDQSEYEAIRDAKDVTFIVAAGNGGLDIDRGNNQAFYPARYRLPNIKVVGALTQKCGRLWDRSPRSNYGVSVRYWQDGVNIPVLTPIYGRGIANAAVGAMSGTSMATAIATGRFIAGELDEWVEGRSPGNCDRF